MHHARSIELNPLQKIVRGPQYESRKQYFKCTIPVETGSECGYVSTFSDIIGHTAFHLNCFMFVCNKCQRQFYDHNDMLRPHTINHKSRDMCRSNAVDASINVQDRTHFVDLWKARNVFIVPSNIREYLEYKEKAKKMAPPSVEKPTRRNPTSTPGYDDDVEEDEEEEYPMGRPQLNRDNRNQGIQQDPRLSNQSSSHFQGGHFSNGSSSSSSFIPNQNQQPPSRPNNNNPFGTGVYRNPNQSQFGNSFGRGGGRGGGGGAYQARSQSRERPQSRAGYGDPYDAPPPPPPSQYPQSGGFRGGFQNRGRGGGNYRNPAVKSLFGGNSGASGASSGAPRSMLFRSPNSSPQRESAPTSSGPPEIGMNRSPSSRSSTSSGFRSGMNRSPPSKSFGSGMNRSPSPRNATSSVPTSSGFGGGINRSPPPRNPTSSGINRSPSPRGSTSSGFNSFNRSPTPSSKPTSSSAPFSKFSSFNRSSSKPPAFSRSPNPSPPRRSSPEKAAPPSGASMSSMSSVFTYPRASTSSIPPPTTSSFDADVIPVSPPPAVGTSSRLSRITARDYAYTGPVTRSRTPNGIDNYDDDDITEIPIPPPPPQLVPPPKKAVPPKTIVFSKKEKPGFLRLAPMPRSEIARPRRNSGELRSASRERALEEEEERDDYDDHRELRRERESFQVQGRSTVKVLPNRNRMMGMMGSNPLAATPNLNRRLSSPTVNPNVARKQTEEEIEAEIRAKEKAEQAERAAKIRAKIQKQAAERNCASINAPGASTQPSDEPVLGVFQAPESSESNGGPSGVSRRKNTSESDQEGAKKPRIDGFSYLETSSSDSQKDDEEEGIEDGELGN